MSQKQIVWLWVGILLGGIMAVRTGNNIMRLYKAGGRVKEAQMELQKLIVEKEKLEQRAQESNTEEALERVAREKLGLGRPGEVVVIIDDDPKSNVQGPTFNDSVPNWQLWRKLYFGF